MDDYPCSRASRLGALPQRMISICSRNMGCLTSPFQVPVPVPVPAPVPPAKSNMKSNIISIIIIVVEFHHGLRSGISAIGFNTRLIRRFRAEPDFDATSLNNLSFAIIRPNSSAFHVLARILILRILHPWKFLP